MKAKLTFLIIFFSSASIFAQDNLKISDKIQPISESSIFNSPDFFNWGGSIIKGEDNKYHLFYSRWPKSTNFTGWLLYSEIAHAVSDTPSGPWKYKETALSARGKGYWDAITAHNPKIKYFEGKYYLYYISTNLGDNLDYNDANLLETATTGYSHPNWKILRPNQRTGVAVAESLNGPWTRKDEPLIEPSGPITTLTVNPAIDQGKDGKYYLIVKGDKPNETKFIRNQAMAIGDRPDGPFVIQSQPVIDFMDTEDMSLWFDKDRNYFYAVFHAHQMIGMMSSEDGLHWEKATEFQIMEKMIKMKDGRLIKPDRLERPFVFIENGEVKVLGLAGKIGDDSFIYTIPLSQ
ncbi:glycoside hydrolase family protein [Algoriphagus machipongonensis]|uniref:Glycosyl hydrolases family 43 n=1 Tax=Algoriphagus machipongonensis TaxID=388413 RepID=A3HZ01_9BACT|nr:glycoside hydrolase family protein [Algoriphagus machipongonensis]EAZ80487.1 hypothetical protein ALPR1_06175 [Algoriphagus machipongonensis]